MRRFARDGSNKTDEGRPQVILAWSSLSNLLADVGLDDKVTSRVRIGAFLPSAALCVPSFLVDSPRCAVHGGQ